MFELKNVNYVVYYLVDNIFNDLVTYILWKICNVIKKPASRGWKLFVS